MAVYYVLEPIATTTTTVYRAWALTMRDTHFPFRD